MNTDFAKNGRVRTVPGGKNDESLPQARSLEGLGRTFTLFLLLPSCVLLSVLCHNLLLL